MSNVKSRVLSNRSRISVFHGVFYPAATAAVTGEANTARAIVARTNPGKITVTFPIFYKDFYGATAQLHLASANGDYAQIDSFTANSSGYAVMVIGTYAAANSAADIAANAANMVCWSATVRE